MRSLPNVEKLKRKRIYFLLLSVALLFVGCDMKKNTAFNRKYQAINTRYNVYYNANESCKKGYKKMEESFSPDYSHIIPVFAISDPSTEGVAKGDMTRTVEKCELAVQERSMQKKPKKKYEKMRDPAYVAFYNQEEFNTYMDEVWMLMGQAKFYSNDYLAASATFTYVIKHFSGDDKLVLKASIWKARALKELGWYYEAEEILSKIDEEELPVDVVNLYQGARADLYLAQKEYQQAMPHLLKAVETEKNRIQRTRFNFVIAQLYQMQGDKEKAYEYYDKVIKANPSYQMTFNANILQTEVVSGSSTDLVKRLEKLAKNRNNADYLDQIYYAMGNIYLSKGDTTKALAYYQTSADTSVRNGREKAQTLITMGDIYYGKKNYVKAQPYYSEASSIIDQKHDDYERVFRLSVMLDELVQNYDVYTLQDSLLYLASASKQDLSAAISRAIQKIVDEEKRERERLAREREEQKQLELEIENMAVMDSRALGMNQESSWYFYNKSTVDKGKLEFRKKFGQRRLEDYWNRRNKSIMVFAEENLADKVDLESMGVLSGDSIKTDTELGDRTMPAEQNPKRPEYYLRQIPFNDDQKVVAHEELSNALFNMAVVYDEKLQDYPKALETYEEFIRRYPNDPRAADAYYCCYRIAGKQKDDALSDKYRSSLIAEYPQSKYAKILSNPDFREKLVRMQEEQDSLYEQTYAAYLKGDFETVKQQTKYMETNYPVSSLMPKFLLLNSLSIGKTMGKDTFAAALNNLLERYPSSDVSSMAKDILALINQGNIPSEGTNVGSLLALREEAQKEEAAEMGVVSNKGFTVSYQTPYLFNLLTDTAKVDQNKLLYETAMYNFTKFLIKDFDISIKSGILSVSGLDNYDEALWYINGIIADEGIQKLLSGTEYKYLLITPENLDLIGKGYTLEQYEQFYKDSIMSRKRNNRVSVELVDEKKEETVEEQKQDDKLESYLNKQSETPVQNPLDKKEEATVNQPQKNTESAEKTVEPQLPKKEVEESKPQINEPKKDSVAVVSDEKDKPKKELKKYKGLYTYDPSAPHYFVMMVTSGSVDSESVLSAINKYNSTNHALLNLSVVENSTKDFPQMFVVGTLASADLSISYLKQVVKNMEIKKAFGNVPYRNIIISKDNLEVLKTTGNINVYMELYKRLYLNR